jgi:hypothetical protein
MNLSRVAGCLLAASLLGSFSNAAIGALVLTKQTVVSKEERRKFDAWRKSMARVRLPHKGCYKTSYPNTDWREVPCTAAPELGRTRAAVCLDPTRLIIDGQPSSLGPDQSITLPSGVHVARSTNSYLFTRPSGESVRADVNAGYINVSVNLGTQPQAKVYGLLGNANGNMGEDDLATRNRVVLPQPVSFADLYHPYADSWRIAASDSLVTNQCGEREVERSAPSTTFYARDLEPRIYERSRAICTEAGVTDETLLDACIIDVTVIGSRDAARVFARMHPPRAELRVAPPRR